MSHARDMCPCPCIQGNVEYQLQVLNVNKNTRSIKLMFCKKVNQKNTFYGSKFEGNNFNNF